MARARRLGDDNLTGPRRDDNLSDDNFGCLEGEDKKPPTTTASGGVRVSRDLRSFA